MRLAVFHLLFICFMVLFPCMKSMGIIGTIPQPIGMGEVRCVVVDTKAAVVYLVYSSNAMWVINANDFTQSILDFNDWPPRESNRVRQCTISDGLLYMVGTNGFRAVVTPEGRTLYISPGEEGSKDLTSPIVVSPVPSSTLSSPSLSSPFIHQFYSSNTSSTSVVLFGSNSTQITVELGIVPDGGGVAQGLVYFYGNNNIVKLTNPLSTDPPQRLKLSFNIGGVSPDGLRGYFLDASGTCGVTIHVVNMVSLQVISSHSISPPPKHSFCAWVYNERKLFIDDNYIYFLVYFTQTIYKISRETYKIEDMLAADQIGTWVYMNGLIGDERMIGFYSSLSLYIYSRVTCPRNSYIIGNTCHICPIGSQPNREFSATECTFCEAGTYGKEGEAGYCTECPEGTYASEPGTIQCRRCPVGTTGPSGSKNISACTTCDYGFYRSAAGTCESCDGGFYSDVLEAGGCNRCNAGTYSQQNSSSCSLCLDRTYSLEGASTCILCPAGTHSNGPGASSCTPCKDGYISQTASTSCTICPPGTYKSSESTCLLCSEGTYAPLGGSLECTPCAKGSYNNFKGQTKCLTCGKGKFSSDGMNCTSCNKDIWNSSGLCTPVAQISLGVVGFVVLVAGTVGFLFWLRRRRRRAMYNIEAGDEDDSSDDESDDEDSSGEEEVVEYDVAD